MRCRRIIKETEDYVLRCGENIFPDNYLLCGTAYKKVVSSLVYFGSYGSNKQVSEVTEYGSACANIQITNRLFLGTGISYNSEDAILVIISNVSAGDVTITFPSSVKAAVTGRAYIESLDVNIPIHARPSSTTFTSKTITVPEGTTVAMFYFTIDSSSSRVTIEKCKNATITYNKTIRSAKWAPDKITFAGKQEGVACSLTQRLNILEGELWYNVNEGLPLFNKDVTITSMDAWIVRTIMRHPDVVSILSFDSRLVNHEYRATTHILSKYGELDLQI